MMPVDGQHFMLWRAKRLMGSAPLYPSDTFRLRWSTLSRTLIGSQRNPTIAARVKTETFNFTW
jgi:hypothetical protein